jgi:hypothetical protein
MKPWEGLAIVYLESGELPADESQVAGGPVRERGRPSPRSGGTMASDVPVE